MADKLKELKTLLQFSEALGVEADPVVVSEIKVLEAEQKRQNVLESIKSKQTKARVITEIKTDPEPSGVVSESSEALISKAKELLSVRDQTWAKLYEIFDEVKAGTCLVPSGFEDIEAELPVLEWPTV